MSSKSKNPKVHRLVPPPTVGQLTRADTARVLREALARCERGEVDECLIILKHPGAGDFTVTASETPNLQEWLGKLEMLKFEWQMHLYHQAQEQE